MEAAGLMATLATLPPGLGTSKGEAPPLASPIVDHPSHARTASMQSTFDRRKGMSSVTVGQLSVGQQCHPTVKGVEEAIISESSGEMCSGQSGEDGGEVEASGQVSKPLLKASMEALQAWEVVSEDVSKDVSDDVSPTPGVYWDLGMTGIISTYAPVTAWVYRAKEAIREETMKKRLTKWGGRAEKDNKEWRQEVTDTYYQQLEHEAEKQYTVAGTKALMKAYAVAIRHSQTDPNLLVVEGVVGDTVDEELCGGVGGGGGDGASRSRSPTATFLGKLIPATMLVPLLSEMRVGSAYDKYHVRNEVEKLVKLLCFILDVQTDSSLLSWGQTLVLVALAPLLETALCEIPLGMDFAGKLSNPSFAR